MRSVVGELQFNRTERMVKPERIREYSPHSRSSKIFGEDFSFLSSSLDVDSKHWNGNALFARGGERLPLPPSPVPNRANEAVSGRWELGIADSKRENEKYALSTHSVTTTLVC